MRLFIAVDLPDRSKKLIESKIVQIKKETIQDIKWVDPENWHLTLKFLGEVAEEEVEKITSVIASTAVNFSKFTILLRGINAFPEPSHPRVFFIDILDKGRNLCKIHDELDTSLELSGFNPDERQYKPHLTFARSRKNSNLNKLGQVLESYQNKYYVNVHAQISELKLYESELYPEGPHYKEIYVKSLS